MLLSLIPEWDGRHYKALLGSLSKISTSFPSYPFLLPSFSVHAQCLNAILSTYRFSLNIPMILDRVVVNTQRAWVKKKNVMSLNLNATLSSNTLHWPIYFVQTHIPRKLLCHMNSIILLFTWWLSTWRRKCCDNFQELSRSCPDRAGKTNINYQHEASDKPSY